MKRSPSFRPLSGKWGYRSELAAIEYTIENVVSVPSRGNGVIDTYQTNGNRPLERVSVPSRGNGVIDWQNRKLSFAAFVVSVPSRGNGIIDLASMLMVGGLSASLVSVPSRGNGVIDFWL